MITLDKLTREAITACVMKAEREAHEMYDEVWLTGKQLSEQVAFFKKEWLKRYGDALGRIGCRKEVKVKDRNGVIHRTGWCYPKHRILRMIEEGEMDWMEMPEEKETWKSII